MNHGTEAFFVESARCRRRVSGLSVGCGLLLVAALGATQLPFARRLTAGVPIARFGLEGRNRYVALVQIEAVQGVDDPLVNVGRVEPLAAGGGRGGGKPAPARAPAPPSHAGPRLLGPGEAEQSLVARALSGQSRVPIFQSEELVIEHLVRPEYPDDVRNRGIEGKVAVLALVDTAGHVADAEVMSASGEPELDHAAEDAVRQCRFRPYQEGGVVREVYAVFRFAFRIY